MAAISFSFPTIDARSSPIFQNSEVTELWNGPDFSDPTSYPGHFALFVLSLRYAILGNPDA